MARNIDIENLLFRGDIRLLQHIEKFGVRKLRLTSFVNSIGSGYSMLDITEPLFERNTWLRESAPSYGIAVELYHFARSQNNSDGLLLDWLLNNISLSEVYRCNRNDYTKANTDTPVRNLSDEFLDKYYPLNPEVDVRLRDTTFEDSDDLANIVVYNGCTGSILDKWTRNKHCFRTGGIPEDLLSLEAILKIYLSNNQSGANTQIYLCGAPDYRGVGVTEVINRPLRDLAHKYPHTTYVDPVKAKGIYSGVEPVKNDSEQWGASNKAFNKLHLAADSHLNEEEYLELNLRIVDTIFKNYLLNKALIDIDRELIRISKLNEFGWNNPDKDKVTDGLLDAVFTKWLDIFKYYGQECDYFFEKLIHRVRSVLPHYYYFVGEKLLDDKIRKFRSNR